MAGWDGGGNDVEVNRDKSSHQKTLIVFALFASP